MRSFEVDKISHVRDYPACNVGYEVKGPDGRVYSVSCVGVSAPGNLVYVTAVCPKEGGSDSRSSLDAALKSLWPSAYVDSAEGSFERLLFGIRFSLPNGFVEKPSPEKAAAEGLYRVDYGPSYGGEINVSVQSTTLFGNAKGVSSEEIFDELVFRSGRLQNTFGMKGEEGKTFLRYVDEGEARVAGVRSWKTVYEYLDGGGTAMRVYQMAMAFEGRSVSMRLECPVEAADYCATMFQGIVDSVNVVDDLGFEYEVRQTRENGVIHVGNRGVFTGVARLRGDGYGRAVAYLEMPGNLVVKKGADVLEQNTARFEIVSDEAGERFMEAFREHVGERVAVVGSLAGEKGNSDSNGLYKIVEARLVGTAASRLSEQESAERRSTAIGFAVDLLARGELHDGGLSHKDHDAYRKYVDPSSELYEFGDDEVEPSVLYQGGSLDIAADATVADEVGNVIFVDVDCRACAGEGDQL